MEDFTLFTTRESIEDLNHLLKQIFPNILSIYGT